VQRQPRPTDPFGANAPTPTLVLLGEFVVECTVCHIVGLVERPPPGSATPWAATRCVFTDDCPGHMWPHSLN
jgi:hypothetical protein